jgi:hypothetical protein
LILKIYFDRIQNVGVLIVFISKKRIKIRLRLIFFIGKILTYSHTNNIIPWTARPVPVWFWSIMKSGLIRSKVNLRWGVFSQPWIMSIMYWKYYLEHNQFSHYLQFLCLWSSICWTVLTIQLSPQRINEQIKIKIKKFVLLYFIISNRIDFHKICFLFDLNIFRSSCFNRNFILSKRINFYTRII